jgi:hypothetical protein
MNYKVRTEVQYGRIRMNNLDLPTNKRIALPVSLTPPSLRGSPLVSCLEYPLRPPGVNGQSVAGTVHSLRKREVAL